MKLKIFILVLSISILTDMIATKPHNILKIKQKTHFASKKKGHEIISYILLKNKKIKKYRHRRQRQKDYHTIRFHKTKFID